MEKKIAVLGLGYVGLPLAVGLAKKNHIVFGYDINQTRIEQLRNGEDITLEVDKKDLNQSSLKFATHPRDICCADIFIITVPTPIDEHNKPDITSLKEASKLVGKLIKETKGKIVIFESTVYPGITENICGKIIEDYSNLTSGKDFFLAYAPERMNPGDKTHHLENITKVVAAQTPEVASEIAKLYGQLNNNNVFIAKNIQTAEAAKVIENTQRDINIAFMNEVSMIFKKMDLSVYDVLDAAKTKWNFLPFTPGLVGGHCIGVDPYYLAQCGKNLGLNPDVILSGRQINNAMSSFLGEEINKKIPLKSNILVLGVTFKENVPDMRNSKVGDLIYFLKEKGHSLTGLDPLACKEETEKSMNISLLRNLSSIESKVFDAVILAVPHNSFQNITSKDLGNILKPSGIVFDIKGFWREKKFDSLKYWCL